MGLDFGGGSKGVKLSGAAKNSNSMLLQALNPALISGGGGGFGNDKGFASHVKDSGINVGSVFQGLPGVQTFDSMGNAQPVGSNDLPTLLPSFGSIGTFNTLGEKFSGGSLDPASGALYGEFLDTSINGPTAFNPETMGGYFQAGAAAASGGGGGAGGGSVGYVAPPSIGELTGDIIADLPPNMQNFINNTLEDPQNFDQYITEFEDAVSSRMQLEVEEASMATMDAFAAQGLGTSGTAVQAMKEIAINATVQMNEQIAAYRMGFIQEQTKRMQIGEQLMNDLLAAGASEQANLVALETQKMASNAAIMQSQIAAQTQLQTSLISASASLEAALISSHTSLELGRMDMLTSGFKGLQAENQLEEQARIDSQVLPYNLLLGLGTGLPTTGGGSSGGFGVDASGLIPLLPGQ